MVYTGVYIAGGSMYRVGYLPPVHREAYTGWYIPLLPALYEGWAHYHLFINQCVSHTTHDSPVTGLGFNSVF